VRKLWDLTFDLRNLALRCRNVPAMLRSGFVGGIDVAATFSTVIITLA
jgi:hypothetical protein